MVSTVLTPFFQCFLNVLTLNGEGKNSNTGWTLLDVTHESGSGVTAWNSNEERDYALNKDTTPAIWVMALKSTASHTMHSVGQKEFSW